MASAGPRSAFPACRAFFLLVLGGLLNAPAVMAHLFLTEETLEDALRSIAKWHAEIPDDSGEPEAIFRMGEAAWSLVDLMNEEVRVHGLGQQALMMEAIERARAYDVSIAWSDDHQRFFYDGDAYRRYLASASDGAFAADSRYRLIETEFYLGSSDSIAQLQARARDKLEFLDDYPGYAANARVGIFLGIDYRDLYRLCLGIDAAPCEQDYAKLALQQFEQVARAHADGDSGEVARRLMQRTRDEIDARQ